MAERVASRSETLERIAAFAPEVAGGWEQIRAVVDADGALPASTKALLVAAAAAAHGHDDLARRELERGRALGLDDADVAGAAASLLLSRGEAVCERFAAAAGGVPEGAPLRPADEHGGEAYFLAKLGVDELPIRMALLKQRSEAVFEGYHRLHHGTLRADPTTAKLSELLMCCVNAAELQAGFVAIHAATARAEGATDEELFETILCAIVVGGIAAWASTAVALFGPSS
jgi:alkylhydroperoxidase/carboxymuconolactone decarboxylase family protein YurZ